MKIFPLTILALALALALVLATTAVAAPRVSIDTVIEVEQTDETGTVTGYAPAGKVIPGETVRITLAFSNSGDSVAENVILHNRIPENAVYLSRSATTYGGSVPLFSIDGGTNYGAPAELTIEEKDAGGRTVETVAGPEHYTDIRWKLLPLAAGTGGEVSFKIIIE